MILNFKPVIADFRTAEKRKSETSVKPVPIKLRKIAPLVVKPDISENCTSQIRSPTSSSSNPTAFIPTGSAAVSQKSTKILCYMPSNLKKVKIPVKLQSNQNNNKSLQEQVTIKKSSKMSSSQEHRKNTPSLPNQI